MTAKQRAARAKFKAVVKEASKLRKKNPKLTQAEAVKQAWAISYGKERSATNLAGVKKSKYKVGDKVYRNYDSFKKSEPGKIIYVSYTAPYLYKLKLEDGFSNYLEENDISKKAKYKVSEMGAVKKKKATKKKSATKVKAKKSKRTSEMHTDTKSHNVNIRVISGLPRAKKFIKIPAKEKTWFRYYVNGFYGKKGVQSAALKNNGFTRSDLNKRLNMFFKIQHEKGIDSWNGGDSIDRERFRDMFLMDQVKKGVTIY